MTDADSTNAKKEKYSKLYHLLRQANASKYEATDPSPCEVQKGLWVGSIGSVKDLSALKKVGITHILSAGFGMQNPHPDNLQWMGINITDSSKADLLKHFDKAHDFINAAQPGGVLVHCHQGKSRSVTIIASYLIKNNNMDLQQAMETIRAARPQADPNAGFIAQLLKYQRTLKEQRSKEPSSEVAGGSKEGDG
eukprot:TRINITY_DN9081_c0_g2_i1.p1 TRINITY_DN9081_c0_g2~~TRINITY_DN9081_c0_g2_i1.p1  ORF type:complete len:194 (+),score=27.20 TRINITY_DN9081_c0_g2_i1:87-668(+)